VGEFLIIVGTFHASFWAALGIATGLVLGAAYALWLYRRVVFGPLEKADLTSLLDLSGREILIFAPILLFVLWIGIYPKPYLDAMHSSVLHLIKQVEGTASL
jgi:NADH-quinone oxidoreductase subunit M